MLLVRSSVRRFLGELVRTSLPKVAVLSFQEVAPARAIQTAAIVGDAGEEAAAAPAASQPHS